MTSEAALHPQPRWLRPALAVLSVPNLVAGIWAVLAPANWYENFPGWAPHLVAALPPFNEHLATDAGAGLLTVGVLCAVAFALPRLEVIAMAMVGSIAFAGPHTLFHIVNPADAMTDAENLVNVATLVGQLVIVGFVVMYLIKARHR